MYSPHSSNTFK